MSCIKYPILFALQVCDVDDPKPQEQAVMLLGSLRVSRHVKNLSAAAVLCMTAVPGS